VKSIRFVLLAASSLSCDVCVWVCGWVWLFDIYIIYIYIYVNILCIYIYIEIENLERERERITHPHCRFVLGDGGGVLDTHTATIYSCTHIYIARAPPPRVTYNATQRNCDIIR
jgi:hypothetical protein